MKKKVNFGEKVFNVNQTGFNSYKKADTLTWPITQPTTNMPPLVTTKEKRNTWIDGLLKWPRSANNASEPGCKKKQKNICVNHLCLDIFYWNIWCLSADWVTCYTKHHAIKQQPALMAICGEEYKDVVWWNRLKNGWVMMYNVVNTNKGSGQRPYTHDRGEDKAHSCGTKFLKQKQNNQNKCRQPFHKSWNQPKKLILQYRKRRWFGNLKSFSTYICWILEKDL